MRSSVCEHLRHICTLIQTIFATGTFSDSKDVAGLVGKMAIWTSLPFTADFSLDVHTHGNGTAL